MQRSSVFKLKIDFEKSRGAVLADRVSGREFLDFFGMYSTLALGYSHPVFETAEFREDILRTAHLRPTLCEMGSAESDRFYQTFAGHLSMRPFPHFHFACTGALAVEAAIKLAIDQKGSRRPKIVSLKESFHGINGYGGFVTDRAGPVRARLEGFPEMEWFCIHNPKIAFRENRPDKEETRLGFDRFREELEGCLRKAGEENIAALLVEPIQATAGDHYFPDIFFSTVREWCDRHRVALIFDEIQTGFGVTGEMWYYEKKKTVPDIVVFGKKAQVCGVLFRENMGNILERPIRLEVTWDGDLIHMIRATHILRAFEKYGILENVRRQGGRLLGGLREIPGLLNVRGEGLLAAFDFETPWERDAFCERAFQNGLLFNRTREKTVRLRPPLSVTESETEKALEIIRKSV